jgi:phage shock protein E
MSSRSFVFAILVTLSAVACGGGAPPPANDASHAHVDGSKAKKLVAGGAKLIDVRGPDEYAAKHVEGAENFPVENIVEQDLGNKDAPIVLYCDNGNRAARAAATLRAKGYTHVYELGGMSNWDK